MKATWLMNAQSAADARYERVTNWHPYFAILPKWVAPGDCRWLEWIERRGECGRGAGITIWWWEYRAKSTENEVEPMENV
jgi:hypothetical protein